MSMSIRSALVPAVAMATVGAVALSPVMVAPGQSVLPAVPGIVRTADVEMAGIGHADFGQVRSREARVEIAGISKAAPPAKRPRTRSPARAASAISATKPGFNSTK